MVGSKERPDQQETENYAFCMQEEQVMEHSSLLRMGTIPDLDGFLGCEKD